MKVYCFDVVFNVKNKQGVLLNNHPITLKLKNNTGFFLEDDSEGLLNGTPTQSKAFVSSNIGRVTARVYFKTPESISFLEDNISSDIIRIVHVPLSHDMLSLDFDTTINVGDTVDFTIKCVDPNLNGISETIDILVDGDYYDSIQTDVLGNATYNYNNTETSGEQLITIEHGNAMAQSKTLVINDGAGV